MAVHATGGGSGDAIVMAWCGPSDHGVTMFGRELFEHAVAAGFSGSMLATAGPAELATRLGDLPAGTRLMHLQVNDWLFADGELSARDRLTDLASRLRSRGIALSVTLHDLPHTAVSDELYRRRVATYAAVAELAVGIVVASRHEERLLTDTVRAVHPVVPVPVPVVMVIPLPVCGHGRPAAPPVGRMIGVFGFVYPGKGHDEVIDDLAALDPPVELLAIGRASTGHEGLLDALTGRARGHGMSFASTGFVAGDEVDTLLQAVAVPVAPAARVSASGSLNSWIGAGRRPLVRAGDYTREFAADHPGTVQLYEPGELRERVLAALADPSSTWLPPDAVVDAGPDMTARRYVGWLRDLVQRC